MVGSVADVRPLASMLRCLSFRDLAVVKMDALGLRFTVEEGRGLQAHAYVNASAFSSYSFSLSPDDKSAMIEPDSGASPPGSPSSSPAPDKTFCQVSISLRTLLECLNIFGNAGLLGGAGNPFKRERREEGSDEDESSGRNRRRMGRDAAEVEDHTKERTSLRISYKGMGEPLILLLEESGIVTRCELTTYEPDGLLSLPFPAEDQLVRLIMKSEWLRDALHELPPSSERLTISFAPPHLVHHAGTNRYKRRRRDSPSSGEDLGGDEDEGEEVPLFRLESTGTLGSTEMDYSDDKDVLEIFECQEPTRNTYKFSHIQLTKNALNASIKTSIRTAVSGLVSFQFMIPLSTRGARASVQEDKIGFVEFSCIALDEAY
ncbi:hypothetical protein JCM11641_001666 [Rhodosporidiobolus odoratus]